MIKKDMPEVSIINELDHRCLLIGKDSDQTIQNLVKFSTPFGSY
jgi:hypothetical protein